MTKAEPLVALGLAKGNSAWRLSGWPLRAAAALARTFANPGRRYPQARQKTKVPTYRFVGRVSKHCNCPGIVRGSVPLLPGSSVGHFQKSNAGNDRRESPGKRKDQPRRPSLATITCWPTRTLRRSANAILASGCLRRRRRCARQRSRKLSKWIQLTQPNGRNLIDAAIRSDCQNQFEIGSDQLQGIGKNWAGTPDRSAAAWNERPKKSDAQPALPMDGVSAIEGRQGRHHRLRHGFLVVRQPDRDRIGCWKQALSALVAISGSLNPG